MVEASPTGCSSTELSPEEELQMITAISMATEPQTKVGDTFCLISRRWWQNWLDFVTHNKTVSANEGSSSEHQDLGSSSTPKRPSSIDNSDLIYEAASENPTMGIELHDTLVEHTDYILVPEVTWNQLCAWYGGGPKLARKVISSGQSQTELSVEVYPLRLRLHLMPKGDQCAIRISKKETIRDLHKKACEIFVLNLEQVSIWDYYSHRKHALMNDLDKSLDDANIQMDQDEDSLQARVYRRTAIQSCHNFKTCLLQLENRKSAIQCLVHTPEFARYFREDYHQEINWHNPLGMVGELALAFGEVLRKLWAPGRTPFAPRQFKAKLARFAPQFSGYNQHDSQELLAFLLDGLHEDLNRVKHKPYIKSRDADGRPDEEVADEYWANHIARNDSIIVDVCQGQYKSTLVCPVCEKVSVTFDPFMYLSLPLQSTTTRTMTVTVFSCDGSALPATCTVIVPKQGRCKDLIQALSNACALKHNEKVFLVEIRNHLIHRFLEDPLMSLFSIKDDDHLSAYKIPKSMKNTKFLQLIHRREELETGNARGTTGWKAYGTPLVFPVSCDATITRGDIQLIVHTMLSPMLRAEPVHSDISDADPSSVASDLTSVKKASIIDGKENDDSKTPSLKLPLKLVDGNNACIDLSVGEERTVRLPSTSMSVLLFIDWSPKLLKRYDTHYLEKLPEVFKYGPAKKTRTEPLSLYTCLEAFLREEPLVPEDMWYCPQCKERRQASKKLDLWRLPEVLVIHLKRFSYSRSMKHKLETFVNFPIHDFDLTNYIANKNNSGRQVYELYALTNHFGSMGSGHYTAHIKLIDENRWYNFDDSHISPVNEDDVKSNAAYVLFYRRVKAEENGPGCCAGGNSSLHK
ncbi:ubiquitin carboxyl-terminal hydrolase 5-like isoform X4 [Cynara cardunculus var. scolymus]|uniref:ubiquitin carboxyl-terminal hydrolase 5-like isoform X4 n=1 Tax=Cynara cardunculus var. scolymus TaxID=59895 RepID=UPI000D62930D|nr:ubiquitin carboxyl-terminal hydrolase 5-like isoform X4 [Cynara cardunculus var. scolymus]